MDASEMGRRGAKATNKLLTPEGRSKAAKKGWRLRKERLGIEKKLGQKVYTTKEVFGKGSKSLAFKKAYKQEMRKLKAKK